MKKFYFLLLVWSISGAALAHGGGLNAEGCHNNRKTGDYHCHRAQTSAAAMPQFAVPSEEGQSYSSGRAKSQELRERRASKTAGPTCYTGPRGGTYTITSSGRKNYSGC